jgi:hypothetical protein
MMNATIQAPIALGITASHRSFVFMTPNALRQQRAAMLPAKYDVAPSASAARNG